MANKLLHAYKNVPCFQNIQYIFEGTLITETLESNTHLMYILKQNHCRKKYLGTLFPFYK